MTRPTQRHRSADALGWFSIGLGAVQLLAPALVTAPLGLRGRERVVRLFGLREIATGIGLLRSDAPAPWLWGRVAGDALDLATLRAGLAGARPRSAGAALAALAGIAVLDSWSARRAGVAARHEAVDATEIERSIVVAASPERLFALLRQPTTLPRMMAHFAELVPVDASHTRWTVPGPVGRDLSWTLLTRVDEAARRIRLGAPAGQAFLSAASLRLRPAPGGFGALVSLRARLHPQLGAAGTAASAAVGELVPSLLIEKALDLLKTLGEAAVPSPGGMAPIPPSRPA